MSNQHIDVRYVAHLARLELSDQEVAQFQPQLEAILDYAQALSSVPLNIDPNLEIPPTFGKMRPDTPHTSLPPSAVTLNAPDSAQAQIRVPKVVTDA